MRFMRVALLTIRRLGLASGNNRSVRLDVHRAQREDAARFLRIDGASIAMPSSTNEVVVAARSAAHARVVIRFISIAFE